MCYINLSERKVHWNMKKKNSTLLELLKFRVEGNFLERICGTPTHSPLGVKNGKIQENSEKPRGPLGTLYNRFRALKSQKLSKLPA